MTSARAEGLREAAAFLDHHIRMCCPGRQVVIMAYADNTTLDRLIANICATLEARAVRAELLGEP